MRLNKLLDSTQISHFHLGKQEIIVLNSDDAFNVDFFAIDATKNCRRIDKDYFGRAIIGPQYKFIESQLYYAIEDYAITTDENGNCFFCFYQEGIIRGFDKNGTQFLDWFAEGLGQGHQINAMDYQFPDSLWLAFPTGQTVTKVSISEQCETYRIGNFPFEDIYDPLCFPEGISVNNKEVYISSTASKELYRLNTETKKLDLLYTFDDLIWQFVVTEFGTFARTDNGLFEVLPDEQEFDILT